MSIKLKINSMDADMVDIYTQRIAQIGMVSFEREINILWGVVHIDMLGELGLNRDDIENCECELKAVR